MTCADEVYGIELSHHYGYTTHLWDQVTPVEEVAYRITRAFHCGRDDDDPYKVRDDNHTWDSVPVHAEWARIRIFKNELSPYFAWNPCRAADGPGALWFDQRYRIATRARLDAEIAAQIRLAEVATAHALQQRDTVRGRKVRAKMLRSAEGDRSLAAQVRERWPQHLGEKPWTPRRPWGNPEVNAALDATDAEQTARAAAA